MTVRMPLKAAAIIGSLAFALAVPRTAPATVYRGVERYARPQASPTLQASMMPASEAPYLSYVSVAYDDHSGVLVMKYAFYEPSLWNAEHMPNPPEVLLGPACTHPDGLVGDRHELLFEVGQESNVNGGSNRAFGLAHLSADEGQVKGSSLLFHSTYYRVEVSSSHFRRRNWRCLTIAPAAQAGPAGPYSQELDEAASVKMSVRPRPHTKGPHQVERTKEHKELQEERKELQEERKERAEERPKERKQHSEETKAEREERQEHEEERREREEERREREEERLEEIKERQEEIAERK